MRLGILAFASCLCLCAQQAGLSGITVDAASQMPLPGVHVSLVSTPDPDEAYGAVSDAAGHFSIGNIRPGTYRFKPAHTGYVYVNEKEIAAEPTVTLKAGEQNSDYRIPMTPEATITGRVIDEFGDPVQGVAVRAVSANDPPPYGLWKMHDETDDRGMYRLTGMPGHYYVEASVHPLQSSETSEIRTDGSSSSAYATTYYPGSLAKERAKVAEVAAGQELTGIDIHVAHRRSLKISGVVTGIPPGGRERATVTIRLRHDNAEASDGTTADADGSYVFGGLPPSEYRLLASYPSAAPGGDELVSPVVRVTIENDDATVNLPVTAGEVMAGTLRVEGDAPNQAFSGTIRLTPADDAGTPTKDGHIAPDGSFVIGRIIPGIFHLEVDPLPENAYIKSVMAGGAETVYGDLDLSNGVRGTTLKVTVSRNGGQISGSITDAQGYKIAGRRLFVVLARDVNSFTTWRTMISADSTFAFHGIRPGKYRLFAIDPAQFGGMSGFEPLKPLAARAEEIEIKEGDSLSKDLKTMGKDAPGAK